MREPSHSFLTAQQELRERSVFPELEFFSPTLRDAVPGQVEILQIESDLLPDLRRHRLVVFGGRRATEKLLFAKHIAWHLSERLKNEGKECSVLQWHPHSALVHVSDALDRYPAHTVFLFPGIQPHHLGGYDLRRLLEHLGSSSQYAIFTTDSELGQWSPTPEGIEREIWHDAAEIIFSPEYLVDMLLCRLQELDRLPGDLGTRVKGLDAEAFLVGNLRVREVADRLKTPSQIRSFAIALSLLTEFTESKVRETLSHVLDERHAVHGWFCHLVPRDQILALGLGLFDGLLDDQVFAALELLVHHAWRDWDPMLSHYDYHELNRVSTYFEGIGELTRTTRIECLSPACRQALLEVGWQFHRRRILATLPALAEIVRDSPDDAGLFSRVRGLTEPARTEKAEAAETGETPPDSSKPEKTSWSDEEVQASRWYRQGRWRDLFGSSLRSGLLRHCVAGTLSEVGRVSKDAVEPILLDLAQDKRQEIQIVAAAALAKWRELDPGEEGDRRLFSLLAAWQSEAFHKEHAQHRRHRRAAAMPYAYVRATIALTLSRASLYDRPNQLQAPLLRLFEKLVLDRSRIVRSRFRTDTVPLLVAGHLQQLEGILWDRVLPEQDLLVGVALGMAHAHRLRPAEARPILENWHRRALALSATAGDADQRHQRPHALAVVALTYGLLVPDSGPDGFSAQQIFDILGGLLAAEDDPWVRAAVLGATINQARTHLEKVASLIQELVADLALEERSLVVQELTELYLEQREQLAASPAGKTSEPDDYEVVDGVRYPIWIETKRPPTPLEQTLHGWLQDPWRPIAIQIALECLESFSDTSLEQRERELREEAEKRAELDDGGTEEEVAKPAEKARLRGLSLAGHFAVFVAVPLSSHQRAILRAALPEYLRRASKDRSSLRAFLQEVWNQGTPRWEKLKDWNTWAVLFALPKRAKHPLIDILQGFGDGDLARQLARAGRIYAWRWSVAAGLALGMLAALAG